MAINFEDLEVWKECRELRLLLSEIAKTFPNVEKYRLTDQLIRASRSVTANIAEVMEGFIFKKIFNTADKSQRLWLTEILDHLICAKDEKLISDIQLNNLRLNIDKCFRLLNRYLNYLQNQKIKCSSLGSMKYIDL
jgi:four helix bundle protein